MINTYKMITKFGKERSLCLEYIPASECSRKGGIYVEADGKIWDIDDDRSIYMIGSYVHWDHETTDWKRTDKRLFFTQGIKDAKTGKYATRHHRVYMGKLIPERAVR